jgi:hypothetical protein
LEYIGEIEKRLWSSADTFRANSNFASNEYFLPVMGLIFLRHAYSRFLSAKTEIEPTLPKRGGRRCHVIENWTRLRRNLQLQSRRDDFTPRLQGRCPEGSVNSC